MIMEKVRKYVIDNQINKREIADKMHISERKLERILNRPDATICCSTYGRVILALRELHYPVTADMFVKE